MIRSGDTVTCLSNAQPLLFPKNTAYQFTNRLPQPWHKPSGEVWRVGVTEFSTVNNLSTIPRDLHVTLTPLDCDSIHSHPQQKIYFFDGLKTKQSSLSTVGFIDQMKNEFPRHHRPYPETGCSACSWNSVNVLQTLAHNITAHTAYRTHLTVAESPTRGILIGVQDMDDFPADSMGVLLSPALQFLLKLEEPFFTQLVFDVNALENRAIEFKKNTHRAERQFWYQLFKLGDRRTVTFKPTTFSVNDVMKGLGSTYDFFEFDEHVDAKGTRHLILRFHETEQVSMVQFSADFFGLNFHNSLYKLSLHFTQDPQVYTITNEATTTLPSLGEYVQKDGKSSTFYLTDGAELHVSRLKSTSLWPKAGHSTFQLTLTHATPIQEMPYRAEQVLSKGNYTDETFKTAIMSTLFKSSPYYSYKTSKKRMSDGSDKNYFTITVKKGSKLSMDERLAAILGLNTPVIGSLDKDETLTGTLPIQVKHFTYNLMIYCKSLIQESLHGGQWEPVLRTLPFPRDAKAGSTLTTEFRTIQYLPIQVSQVEDLTFEIRDDTGDLVPFEDGRTLLKLHFLRELT